ncbi:bax inhibitor 1-like isoform X1 [Capsicum annuum]|uniref:bax inhibitor 1-like isoform X1 n=1 Tax=Capsicum annuum TaxID=4072 RepID=UPI001FB1190A|nr:bax inhibitor 1-like isoform X1 [Capsicum annuum]
MKYSEMKIAAKAYFNRNWNREDMLNPNEIPGHAHKTLKKVYLPLLCTTLAATFGSFLQWIWEAGGLYTVLSTVASLLWLYLTLPWSVLCCQLLGRCSNLLWNFLVWSQVNGYQGQGSSSIPVACFILMLSCTGGL